MQRNEEIMETSVRSVSRNDPEWSPPLDELPGEDPISDLFVLGRPLPDPEMAIAIVGTRRPTVSGLEIAQEMAVALCQAGFSVVSGLAIGIDAAAHRGALEAGGHTVAVLGCGLDIAYPERNLKLRRQIMKRGTLVSEYPLGTPVWPSHFPARNRIIVGLSKAVVVIEGGLRSGAMITARIAADTGRTVYAVPGSPRNAVAVGPNELIRRGATLVTGPDELFQDLAPKLAWRQPFSPGVQHDLERAELDVLHSLDAVPCSPEKIGKATGRSPGDIGLILSKLELRGFARRTRTGQFEITQSGLKVSLATP